jgi:tetratricopeptide (TPR) repeat protein
MNIDDIDRRKFCERIVQSVDNLSDDAFNSLGKLAILQNSFGENKMMKYLGFSNTDKINSLERELIRNGIFDKETKWFRHELIKRCFEDSLSNQLKKNYHNDASKFYAKQINDYHSEKNVLDDTEDVFQTYVAQAYHLYSSDSFFESFAKNQLVGDVAAKLGIFDVAERCYIMAIDAAEKTNNPEGSMEIKNNLAASVYKVWTRWEEALRIFQELENYYLSTQNDKNLSVVIMNIGEVYHNTGNYREGMNRYIQALEIAKNVYDKQTIVNILNRIAMIHTSIGEYDDAMKRYNEALTEVTSIPDRAPILNNLAVLFVNKGNYKEALKKYIEAFEIARDVGDQFGISLVLRNIGEIYLKTGFPLEAVKRYEQSLEIDKKMGNLKGIASNLNNMGVVYDDLRKDDDALTYYEQSLAIAKNTGDKELTSQVLNNIGIIYNRRGNSEEAVKRYKESLEIKNQLNDALGIAKTLVNLGNIDVKKRQYNEARDKFEQAFKIAEKLKNNELKHIIRRKIIALGSI